MDRCTLENLHLRRTRQHLRSEHDDTTARKGSHQSGCGRLAREQSAENAGQLGGLHLNVRSQAIAPPPVPEEVSRAPRNNVNLL